MFMYGLGLAAAYFGWAAVAEVSRWRDRLLFGLMSVAVIAGAVALRLQGAA